MDSVLHKTQAHYGGRRQLHFGGGNGFGGGGGHGESGSPTLDEVFLMGGQGGGDAGANGRRIGLGHGGGGGSLPSFLSRGSDSPDSDRDHGYGTSYGSFFSGGKTQGSGNGSSSDEGSDLSDIMVGLTTLYLCMLPYHIPNLCLVNFSAD